MGDKPKSKEKPVLITRRGFVTHAAAGGAGGVLAKMVGGNSTPLQAQETAPSPLPIPRRPFGKTGADIPIVGFGAVGL